jgi:hypothetical protein
VTLTAQRLDPMTQRSITLLLELASAKPGEG